MIEYTFLTRRCLKIEKRYQRMDFTIRLSETKGLRIPAKSKTF